MTGEPITSDVVDAIRRHMNEDHAEDSLLICRALGGAPNATAAEMVGMDPEGIDFAATVGGQPTAVRVAWSQRLVDRAQVRPEVVRLYHQACDTLGIARRGSRDGDTPH
jgi:putative heme iron utilization protein